MISTFVKYHQRSLALLLLCMLLYGYFAFKLERTEFGLLMTLAIALFAGTGFLLNIEKSNFRFLVLAGVLFRLVFLFSIPNLSQDFYRFIWDGRMLLHGVNPYLVVPEEVISSGGPLIPQTLLLYDGMGSLSAGHYTNYPPVNQLLFTIAALFAGTSITGSVWVLRIIIILADVGILYFGKKLLKGLGLSEMNLFWYFLNPFIIIELTGNLHFEGVMMFFLIWSLYLLIKNKWQASALMLAISVSVKLIPLMFLPLLFKRLGWKQSLFYYAIVGAVVLLLFTPFLSYEFIRHYTDTVGLWFQKFEFNASIYYIVRAIGYEVRGYNIIASVGKVMPWIVVGFIILLALFRKNRDAGVLITSMLFAIVFYLLTATTVHPWYVVTPLTLSLFTRYRFPLIWSLTIFLSYAAYGHEKYCENMWLIGIEYALVLGVMGWEIFQKKALFSIAPKV